MADRVLGCTVSALDRPWIVKSGRVTHRLATQRREERPSLSHMVIERTGRAAALRVGSSPAVSRGVARRAGRRRVEAHPARDRLASDLDAATTLDRPSIQPSPAEPRGSARGRHSSCGRHARHRGASTRRATARGRGVDADEPMLGLGRAQPFERLAADEVDRLTARDREPEPGRERLDRAGRYRGPTSGSHALLARGVECDAPAWRNPRSAPASTTCA